MFRLYRFHCLSLTLLVMLTGGQLLADDAPQSETFLPDTTKGYVSIPDMQELTKHFDQTQVGQLAKDSRLEPFFKDLKKQLIDKLVDSHVRFELTAEDLQGVRSGEVALAVIQAEKDAMDEGRRREKLPVVLLIDVRGNEKPAKDLLAKVSERLRANGAKAQKVIKFGNSEIMPFEFPKKPLKAPVRVYYGLVEGWIVAGNHLQVTQQVIRRVEKPDARAANTIGSLKSFQQVMARCSKAQESHGAYHLRWFADPFGLAETVKASVKRTERGTNYLQILHDQGFSAIKAAGGYVTFATRDHELFHCSYVYAPPVVDGVDVEGRYEKAARMLNFANPNKIPLIAEDWVLPSAASYVSMTWDLETAFNSFGGLVDAVVDDEGLFERILREIKDDPDSAQVDIRGDIIARLDNRVTLVADVKTPITPRSERLLVAIKIKDKAPDIESVQTAMKKIMEFEPAIKAHDFGGIPVWEKLEEEDIDEGFGGIDGVPSLGGDEEDEEPREPIVGLNSFTVAGGYLLISNNAQYLGEVITSSLAKKESLKSENDYQTINAALDRLSNRTDSVRQFGRPDRLLRTTYELVRQGKMPISESVLGKVLNRWMGPDEEGVIREPEIDGAKMPEDYDSVIAPFLGPAGWCVKSESDGWLVLGCMLAKEQEK